MNNLKLIPILTLAIFISLVGCNDDDDALTPTPAPTTGELTLNISGLENLGSDFVYEGWIIVDGVPITAGIFSVNDDGSLSETSFELDAEDIEKATAYALTIEPSPDNDAAPSDVHILAGDFSGSSSNLTVDHALAIGNDFTSASGGYLLGTPTDGSLDSDERSGIWWEDLSSGSPEPGLNLPTLPKGWEYEGWVVIDGIPLTTGKFLEVDEVDFSAPFSGPSNGPPFPGEDFIINAPAGLSFPVDISGMTTAISIEPFPDNSPAPFLLKPLLHVIPSAAQIHTFYPMNNNATASNPIGIVSK